MSEYGAGIFNGGRESEPTSYRGILYQQHDADAMHAYVNGDEVTQQPTESTGQSLASRELSREGFSQIDRGVDRVLAELGDSVPLLDRMSRYHLGLVSPSGDPVLEDDRQRFQGKRFRPLIALLTCVAAGGELRQATSLAAGIELLHNFTLIHDDIQDRSPNRRHRATVWRVWGDAQAINAGDALFAAAQIAVLDQAGLDSDVEQLVPIARAFNRMTIEIVRGQVLDIDFEGRDDVTAADYLGMIERKTAAIVEFAAWSGSVLGGADAATAQRFARFGKALGVGFQIRDDALGVWGTSEETGKDIGDDIRRRKQSLPVLLLRDAATQSDRDALDEIYSSDRLAEDDVLAVLSMFTKYGTADNVAARVRGYHDDAASALDALCNANSQAAIEALRSVTDELAVRSS